MPDVDLPDLTTWLPAQRWFSAKDRPLERAAVVDVLTLSTSRREWLVTVQVDHGDGGDATRWLLVLTSVRTPDAAVVGTVDGSPVVELADMPSLAVGLLRAIGSNESFTTELGGAVSARTTGVGVKVGTQARLMGAEQSNTSVVVDDRVVVKVVRRLEPGPNPDVEVPAALTRIGFDGVPSLVGALVGPHEEAMVVASTFVPDAQDGWSAAVAEAAGRTGSQTVAEDMRALGALTAAMHAKLRQVLPTVEADPADGDRWRASMRRDADRTRQVLASSAPDLARQLPAIVTTALAEAPLGLGVLQRIHGDYHLGQVLRDPEGRWWIIDFEGEPGRPVPERRRPANAAKDVAGMLRSFDYARAQAVREGGDPDRAAAWAERAREAFLDGYGTGVEPWLPAFEIEKLLYEVRYEAANRPDWLQIPLSALLADQPGTTAPTPGEPVPAAPEDERTVAATASTPDTTPDPLDEAARALAEGRLHEPHGVLGFHVDGDGWVVRAWRPGAESVAYLATPDADPLAAEEVHPGLFQVRVAEEPAVGRYRLRVTYDEGGSYDLVDPYSFPPMLGDVDQHLLAEGRHEQAWTVMGANRRTMSGIDGVGFAVWAPNARAVRVVGDFNSWDGRLHPMRTLGASGIWEVFVPDVPEGAYYKYELVTSAGDTVTRADPWAKWTDVPPGTASRVFTSAFQPAHSGAARRDPHSGPVSIYELHMASWRHHDGHSLGYRDLAHQLGDYLAQTGFTHVELLPPAEHPFGGSWGYQVTGQFAPTSRFGSPDDFRYLVDHLHGLGIGVIVDWVPAHFPKDEWALARFDGTALYEHEDPRLGEHPDWGTLVFNYGRREVRNFIVASALFWIESMGVDALRVDAVASMLYLDYSRKDGEWIPNEHGGRENLRAVELLKEVNATVYKRTPDAFTVAEESTAWPGVSRPVHLGGLGFGFKWNMGWMHDTLAYFARDPIHRRWHHDQLTFGLMYAFSENFVLPLSHDEVVHGKGSLLGKMPGDRWQSFANLRALYGWMWGHPGKKLLFMGQEFGQEREWSEERSLDWHLLEDPDHAGLHRMVGDLNRVYRATPALWRRDSDPEGFSWIDANNADDNLLSFIRRGQDGDPDVAVIANLSPSPRHDVRFGLSGPGQWTEIFNSDAEMYGGANIGNLGGVTAVDHPWHGQPASAQVTCPPLGVVWLRRDG